MTIFFLNQKIKRCRKCSLWRTRTQVVPGEGNPRAKILIIGEAPGQEEDKKGQPFCGRAGKFLGELLNLAHLNRQKIFITNVVKCRPPQNRRPKKEEIEKCKPWLEKQIKILKPKLIITLGALALNWFFPEAKISQLYGQIRKFRISNFEFRIFSTYHPAAAFRRGNLRQRLKKDFKKLNKILKNFQRLNQ
jgi:DNA polymerase